MIEIKIRYNWKRKNDGHIYQTITPIECLEGRGDKVFLGNEFWVLLGRDMFTGLHDKNNNDIYEGDILFCQNCFSQMPSRGYVSKRHPKSISGLLVVEYKFGEFDFCFKRTIDEHYKIYKNNKQAYAYIHYSRYYREIKQVHVEIIGNVYENKNLLKI